MEDSIKIDLTNKERFIEVNQGRTLSLSYKAVIPLNLKKSAGGICRQVLPKQLNFGIKTMVPR